MDVSKIPNLIVVYVLSQICSRRERLHSETFHVRFRHPSDHIMFPTRRHFKHGRINNLPPLVS